MILLNVAPLNSPDILNIPSLSLLTAAALTIEDASTVKLELLTKFELILLTPEETVILPSFWKLPPTVKSAPESLITPSVLFIKSLITLTFPPTILKVLLLFKSVETDKVPLFPIKTVPELSKLAPTESSPPDILKLPPPH